jgi:UDP-N-acetylmuramate dehydrogenase
VSALDDVAARLDAALPGHVTRDAPSASLVTYRCGGPLSVLVRVETEADVPAVASAFADAGPVPVLVIGRGSNLVVADAGYRGVAIMLGDGFAGLRIDAELARVDAGGAVALPVLARRAAAAGVTSLEFYVGIPGSVGGAIRMNAGGHGAQTADVVTCARVADLATGEIAAVPGEDLGLGYRHSGLGPRDLVLGASFAGARDDPDECGRRIDEIVAWRREHQPGGQNAGSVFTNPPGDAAGRLIEAAGLKGTRIGGVVVSEKHANFFVAEPGARADDVARLIRAVQERVEAVTGVRLVPELALVGFDEPGGAEPEGGS